MNAKRIIYLDAGHSETDPGSITEYGKETDFNRQIRDLLVPKLIDQGFQVEQVPDDLDLAGSIEWVDQRTNNIDDGLALSLHCNCCLGNGAETYYFGSSVSSKEIATKLLDGYCQETGLARSNGGVRSDTTSRPGNLGWIRKTKPWATLIEMIYLDSKEDVDFFNNNKDKIVNGIIRGILNIYGMEYKEPTKPDERLARIKSLAQQIIDLTG